MKSLVVCNSSSNGMDIVRVSKADCMDRISYVLPAAPRYRARHFHLRAHEVFHHYYRNIMVMEYPLVSRLVGIETVTAHAHPGTLSM